MKNDNSTKQSNASKPMLANRLFKYRFWDTKTKCLYPVMTLEEVSKKMTVNDSLVPLEFTGLKDINGEEIYEGYILKPTIESGKILGKIVWLENRSAFGIHWFLQLGTGDIEYCVNDMKMKIVGNVFENPELLQTTS